jgi:hypothetical protein
MKKVSILFIFLLTFQLSGCRVEANNEEILFRIINATENSVEILFFNREEGTEKVFLYSAEVDGEGLLIEINHEVDVMGGSTLPSAVFQANSAELIFNNTRIEEHNEGEPLRSIFGLNFESVDGARVYTITEENFNNATPCDGPCK